MEIRLLHESDWQGLYDLVEHVDKKMVGMLGEPHDLVEDWVNSIELGVWEVYVAILPHLDIKKEQDRIVRKLLPWKRIIDNGSGIVGLVSLYGDYEEEEELEKGEFDIGITVASPFQKRGIGRQLLDFIIQRGKELGYDTATFSTRMDNLPMQKLAKKFDFEYRRKYTKQGYTWLNFSKKI
ncbi:MAG: GNAT family N-acetyltransferase [Candidatus Thorarchaeota archaeon]